MTHIVFRTVVAGAALHSPVVRPPGLWRVGQPYLSVESPADPAQGPYGLVIARGAQTWLVDRTYHRAYHFFEHSSPFPRAAIVPRVHGRRLDGLYFGNEVALFHAHGIQATGERDLAGVRTHLWTVSLVHGTAGLMCKRTAGPFSLSFTAPVSPTASSMTSMSRTSNLVGSCSCRRAESGPARAGRVEGQHAMTWMDEQGKGTLDRLAKQEQQN